MQRRAIALLTSGHFFNDINQGVVPAFLPFLVAERGLSYAAAGGLVMAATVLSSVVQPLFGWWSDSRSHGWLMPAGVLTAGIGVGLAGVASSYPWIVACVALSGIGVAAFHPEAASTTNRAAGERKATAMSVFAVGGNAGYAAGPLLATPLFIALGVAGSPWLILPAALTAIVLFRSLPSMPAHARAQTHAPSASASRATPTSAVPAMRTDTPDGATADTTGARGARDGLDWGGFARLTGVVVLRSVTFFSLVSFVPLYWVQVLGSSPAAGNAALTLLLLCGIAGTLSGGWLADRFGPRRVVASGLLSAGALIAILVVLTPPTGWDFGVLGLLGVSIYLPFGVMTAIGQAYLWRRLGTASGVTLGLSMTVGGLATPLFGAYADRAGLAAALTLVAVIPVLGALLTATLPPVATPERQPGPGAQRSV